MERKLGNKNKQKRGEKWSECWKHHREFVLGLFGGTCGRRAQQALTPHDARALLSPGFKLISALSAHIFPNSASLTSYPLQLAFICNLTAYTPLNNKRTINLIKSPSDWK